jgi:hypothetical protein
MKFRWYITKKHLVALIGLLTLALIAIELNGCTSTVTARQGQSRTIIEHRPLADGGFVEKRTTVDSSDETAKTKADIDWGAAVVNGVGAAATGDWAALGGIAATALAAGGAALMQRNRANEHKADADEGWSKYEAAMKEKS